MDTLPPEVLRLICRHLNFQDAANVRFLSPTLANVAAEFMVTRVRFHTSTTSLKRLEFIASHPSFSRTIRSIIYEAPLLADVGCRHEYARHFELDHHGLERPKEPPTTCSARERRLHIRNKRKWTQTIYAKYDVYRKLFHAQQSLLDNNVVAQVLSRSIPKFPKLADMDVDPIRRCTHMLSERFVEEFGSDCASPLKGSVGRISDQLTWMLLPGDHIITSLRRLEINALSPSFFAAHRLPSLRAAFKSLTDIDVVLTLADADKAPNEQAKDSFHRHLSTGVFVEALAAAAHLEFLSIGIDAMVPTYIDTTALISNTAWTHLKSLGLSTVSSTRSQFMDMMKRQPKLKSLHIAMMKLTDSNWPDTLTQMRDELHLDTFLPVGFLEDSGNTWPMDLIDVSIYQESREEFDLGDAVDLYVTKSDSYMVDQIGFLKNPLSERLDEFDDRDVVLEMYGPYWDSDDMSLDMSDMSDEEMLDTDSELLSRSTDESDDEDDDI